MGQEPFKGDPKGYAPYDTNYDASNWTGAGTVRNGVLTPSNLGLLYYDKRYSSGKYYYEITTVTPAVAFFGFSNGLTNLSNDMRSTGTGVGVWRREDKMATWVLPTVTTDYFWSNVNGIRMSAGDVFQVWADFDNDRLCVMKLGTSIDDYQNYVVE